MFMKTKPTAEDKQEWYSPGAWLNADISSQHKRVQAAYRGPRIPGASHHTRLLPSTGERVATAAAGTFLSGLTLFWLAYFALKVIMFPTFIVNVGFLISALNTPHGMAHYNPTWLIISGLIVLFG